MKRNYENNRRYRFVVISTCPEVWGGSEELWSRTAVRLAENGHRVSVFKTVVDYAHPAVKRLKSLSCKVRDLEQIRIAQRFVDLFLPARYQVKPRCRTIQVYVKIPAVLCPEIDCERKFRELKDPAEDHSMKRGVQLVDNSLQDHFVHIKLYFERLGSKRQKRRFWD